MNELSTTEITLALAAGLTVSCYAGLILMPALRCYGRVAGEDRGEGFLTLFILGTLLGAGSAIGLAIVWSYDKYA